MSYSPHYSSELPPHVPRRVEKKEKAAHGGMIDWGRSLPSNSPEPDDGGHIFPDNEVIEKTRVRMDIIIQRCVL